MWLLFCFVLCLVAQKPRCALFPSSSPGFYTKKNLLHFFLTSLSVEPSISGLFFLVFFFYDTIMQLYVVLFCFLVTSLFKPVALLLSEEVAFEQPWAASCFLSWCTMLCCLACHLKSDLWDEMGRKRSELQWSVNANGTSVCNGSVDRVLTNQPTGGQGWGEWRTFEETFQPQLSL